MSSRKSRPTPDAGTEYRTRYKGTEFTMEVVKRYGKIGCLVDGMTYRTPSGAARSITGSNVNGWRFWRMA
jgi:hypothetical protein